jgi:glycosyltransferase involved in cell wall biosynthesis
MQELPLISVITVCLNSENTIHHTFDSILVQAHSRIEYIVVDGASTDSTVDIIKKYNEKFKSKNIIFKWSSQKDEGLYDAINKGIAHATGEIIGILNSDDYYEKDAVETIAKAHYQHPEIGIFYGFLRVLSNNSELVIHRYNYDFYLLNLQSGIFAATQHPTCFVKKEIYNSIGNYDTQFAVAADYDFLLRAKINGVKFFALDKVITNFSKGGISDRMTDYQRFEQRNRILFKNQLISESEFQQRKKQSTYYKYKHIKQLIVQKLFHFDSKISS